MVDWFVRVMEAPLSRRLLVVCSAVVLGIALVYTATRELLKRGPVDFSRVDPIMLLWTAVGTVLVLMIFPAARRGRESVWMVYIAFAVHGTFIVWLCHLVGTHTTPVIAWYPLSAILVILVLDGGAGWFGFLWMTWLLVVVAVLEIHGIIPYAPLFVERTLEAQLVPYVYAGYLVAVLGMFGFCCGFAQLSSSARHMQTKRLGEANEALGLARDRLARGNELIRRYVPAQLAERLLSGQADGDRPERRRLTLVFTDIEGFAVTADLVEPEDLSEVLNEYLTEMVAIAERHGGTIDKFVGDAVVVFFGAPVATSDHDHAMRAMRMAMAMQEQLVGLRERWTARGFERPFHVRIGVNTGRASVGSFGAPGRMDYTAIGRHVNLAARLQGRCEPDGILLSHATWVLVKEEFACTHGGEIQVKGFRDPVRVYAVPPIQGPAPIAL